MAEFPEFTTRPELAGTFGMVASTHWLASAAGMAVLEHGGNAFDAAVAAGFVLQVVEPHLNGPGGEVPVIARHAAPGERMRALRAGPAPAAPPRSRRSRRSGLDLVPGNGLARRLRARRVRRLDAAARATTARSRCGDVMRLRDRLRRGRLPAAARDQLRDRAAWPAVPRALADARPRSTCRGGRCPRRARGSPTPLSPPPTSGILDEAEAAGPDREAQIEAARRAFYEGFVAEAIGAFAARRGHGRRPAQPHAGLLTGDDLAGWRAGVEAPVDLRLPAA